MDQVARREVGARPAGRQRAGSQGVPGLEVWKRRVSYLRPRGQTDLTLLEQAPDREDHVDQAAALQEELRKHLDASADLEEADETKSGEGVQADKQT